METGKAQMVFHVYFRFCFCLFQSCHFPNSFEASVNKKHRGKKCLKGIKKGNKEQKYRKKETIWWGCD